MLRLISHLNMIFFSFFSCNIRKDGVSFFQKIWYFFFRRNMKEDDLYKKRMEIWYFLYICITVANMILPSWQKKQRCPCPEKIQLRVTSPASPKKMIFLLENMVFLLKYHIDWHPRKGSRSSHRGCSIRKSVLRNFAKFTGKDLCQNLFFKKVTGLKPATLLKKRPWRRCFPVNLSIFLRTPFLQNTPGRLFLEFQLFSVLLWRPL